MFLHHLLSVGNFERSWSAVASAARHRFGLKPISWAQGAVVASLCRRTPKEIVVYFCLSSSNIAF
jgi:hypothetical protein